VEAPLTRFAGIGFTVALFIAALAFPDTPALLDEAKVGILAASLAAGLIGGAVLRLSRPVEAEDARGAAQEGGVTEEASRRATSTLRQSRANRDPLVP
jgi:hypothetical protein